MQAWRSASVPRVLPPPADLPPVQVFDSASGGLRQAGPDQPGPGQSAQVARLYVCGITPYDATHLGHANTYVTFDLLNRVWRDRGLAVDYVQNVTDVDDPLLERAEQTGEDWTELAAREIQLFREDMTALNVIAPDHYLGAVESIGLVLELVDELQEKGAVYAVADDRYPDLYLRRRIDPDFGSVSHLDDDAARATFAERGGDPDRPGKEDPLDSLLWRLARPGEPAWDSSYGRGRPGWHVECTAIALNLLGTDFDVQGGGSDLVFPHHEMCASCARLATGEPFAKTYVHGGMVGLDGEKMSKSKGNLVLVSKLRTEGVDPMAIRLVLLANRYRDDWSWTPELQQAAADRLALWRQAADAEVALPSGEVINQLRRALAADLDAPTALAAVDAWARQSLDEISEAGQDADAPAQVATAVDALLGVRL